MTRLLTAHFPTSEEQLKAFLEKVKSDTELQENSKQQLPEAALEIAKEGFSIASKTFNQWEDGIRRRDGR